LFSGEVEMHLAKTLPNNINALSNNQNETKTTPTTITRRKKVVRKRRFSDLLKKVSPLI